MKKLLLAALLFATPAAAMDGNDLIRWGYFINLGMEEKAVRELVKEGPTVYSHASNQKELEKSMSWDVLYDYSHHALIVGFCNRGGKYRVKSVLLLHTRFDEKGRSTTTTLIKKWSSCALWSRQPGRDTCLRLVALAGRVPPEAYEQD